MTVWLRLLSEPLSEPFCYLVCAVVFDFLTRFYFTINGPHIGAVAPFVMTNMISQGREDLVLLGPVR